MANVLGALNKGLLKIMSKMGISTVQSYHGAQTFEAIGLSEEFIDRYFTSTPHQLGGKGMTEIAAEASARHADSYRDDHPRPSHRPRASAGSTSGGVRVPGTCSTRRRSSSSSTRRRRSATTSSRSTRRPSTTSHGSS